jgi:hypothetical protein
MAMKISVLHDEHGQIIAISQVEDIRAAGSKFSRAGMIPGKGQRISEILLNDEQEHKSLLELHNEHYVNAITSTLVKKHQKQD